MTGTAVITDKNPTSTPIVSRIGIVSVALTTDASGDASTTFVLNKRIEKILVKIGTLTSGAADVTITDNETAESILALSNITANSVDYVRRLLDGNNGAALTTVYDKFVAKTLSIVVAGGGNTETGTVDIYYS